MCQLEPTSVFYLFMGSVCALHLPVCSLCYVCTGCGSIKLRLTLFYFFVVQGGWDLVRNGCPRSGTLVTSQSSVMADPLILDLIWIVPFLSSLSSCSHSWQPLPLLAITFENPYVTAFYTSSNTLSTCYLSTSAVVALLLPCNILWNKGT